MLIYCSKNLFSNLEANNIYILLIYNHATDDYFSFLYIQFKWKAIRN